MEFLIVALIIVFGWYPIQFLAYGLARFNLFFTLVEEGTARAITQNGQFHRMVMNYSGHKFGPKPIPKETLGKHKELKKPTGYENYWVTEMTENEKNQKDPPWKRILFPVNNMYWVGIPPFGRVHVYHFEWVAVKFDESGGLERFVPKSQSISWIVLQKTVYGLVLKDVETKGNIPATVNAVVTGQVENPALAIFGVRGWLNATMQRIGPELRSDIGKYTLSELVSPDQKESESHGIKKEIESIEDETIPWRFGFNPERLQISAIEPDQELKKLTYAIEQARLEGKAKRITAKADAAAIRMVNEEASKASQNTIAIRGLATLEKTKSNVTIISQGLPVAPLSQTGLTPGKEESDATRQ